MAPEKPRAPRARTTKTGQTTADEPRVAARPRTRRRAVEAVSSVPTAEAIAFHAHLLWERGEPGGPDEHWLRAERELLAA